MGRTDELRAQILELTAEYFETASHGCMARN